MKPAAIHVHIDELMLDGFDPHQRHAIADAIERELSALITAQPLSATRPRALRHDEIDAGSFNLSHVIPPAIGRSVAGSLHQAMLNVVSMPRLAGASGRSN